MDNSKDTTVSPRASEFQSPEKSAPEEDTSIQCESTGIQNEVPSSAQSKELLDSALHFLSTASNETLLCVFACLMIATYIVLGRLGLILIGTIIGVILHASWEGGSNESRGHGAGTPNSRRRDFSLHVANKLLDWSTRKQPVDTRIPNDSTIDLDYSTFRPKTAVALKSLTDAAIKDYVK